MRLFFQRRRVVFCFALVFIGIVVFELGGERSNQFVLIKALATAFYAVTWCVVGIIVTPKCRHFGDLAVLIVFVSSIIYQILRVWGIQPTSEPYFIALGAAVGAVVGFLLFCDLAKWFGLHSAATVKFSFVTSASREEVWHAIRPRPGEEKQEWSGTVVSISDIDSNRVTIISAIGWGRYISAATEYRDSNFPNSFEVECLATIGKIENGLFVAGKPNAIKYRQMLNTCVERTDQIRVDGEIQYLDIPAILVLGFWLDDYGKDIGSSMEAHFEGRKDRSMTNALVARGRRDAIALREV